MKISEQVKNLIATRKGVNTKINWKRDCKVKKNCPYKIEKATSVVGRLGLSYDSLKAVKESRSSGESPAENSGLVWGRWQNFPYLIEHKDKLYLRISPGSVGFIPRSIYFRDGKVVEFKEIEEFLYASEKKTDKNPKCLSVKCENIEWSN